MTLPARPANLLKKGGFANITQEGCHLIICIEVKG